MNNSFYVRMHDYDAVLDLNKITSLQRFGDRIVIHFSDSETFTVDFDQEEFEIINSYFEAMMDRSITKK